MKNTRVATSTFIFTCLFFLASHGVFAQLNLDAAFNPNVSDAPGSAFINLPLPDGKILVGGNFHLANSVARRNLVRFNADGSLDASFNADGSGPNSSVYAIVPVADGKFLIGGSFSTYNDFARGAIVRINADGTLDNTFNPGGSGVSVTGSVQTISFQADGKILICGGRLSSYNGNISNSIARLNADGTFDSSFVSGFANAVGQFVEEIHATPSGKIFISGNFQVYSGVETPGIALLFSNGALDVAFDGNVGIGLEPVELVANVRGAYGSKVQADGKILIGGDFEGYNGTPIKFIARLNVDGTLDTTFVPATSSFTGSGGEFFTIQPDGKIIVSGGFEFGGANHGAIRLNPDGSLDSSFTVGSVDLIGYSTGLQADSKIVLTGFFTRFNGADRFGVVRLNPDGTVDPAFNAGVSRFGQVNAMAIQPDGKTIVAGNFLTARGVPIRNIARFDVNGDLDPTFDPGTGTGYSPAQVNQINTVAVQSDGKIIIGGHFKGYDGSPAPSIARLNQDGSIDPSFDNFTLGEFQTSLYPTINDILVLPDGKIMVAGLVVVLTSEVDAASVLRLTPSGGIDPAFTLIPIGAGGSGSRGVVRIVREPSGTFLIGGGYRRISADLTRPKIARLTADGNLDLSFSAALPGVAGTIVEDIVVEANGNIVIGGLFNTVSGQTRNGMARIFPDGTLDTTFNPGTGADNSVFSIARRADGKYYVGGAFSTFNSAPTNRLLLLNSDGSTDTSFVSGVGPNAANFVRRLMFQPDGKLLVGGAYNLYGGFPRGSLVRLSDTSAAAEVGPGNTIAEVGGTTIQFSNVTSGGTVLVTPISPASVNASLPGNYAISDLNLGFEIQTTATYTGSIVIAFRVPNTVTASEFSALRILHGESGNLVDRTILGLDAPAPDFANRTIYARVTSLSPFVIGRKLTPTNKNECKNGGWRGFNVPVFGNQGQCVSYVESNSPIH